MQKLNFPTYQFRFKKNKQNEVLIFDESRKKFVLLTPEEWVRQNALRYLIKEKNYPISLIEVEKKIELNGLIKRFDLVCKNPDGSVYLLLECKAPEVKLSQATFDQIVRYNNTLQATILWVTNGLEHFIFEIVTNNSDVVTKLKELPLYE